MSQHSFPIDYPWGIRTDAVRALIVAPFDVPEAEQHPLEANSAVIGSVHVELAAVEALIFDYLGGEE